jgi:uncharacterized damage-inducible protein DinB
MLATAVLGEVSATNAKALQVPVLILVALLLVGPATASAQPANPLTGGARLNYRIIKDFVTRAAEKMPEEYYSFAPTAEVRSFARLVGHLADANYRLCSVVAGQNPPRDAGIENSKTSKADLAKALAESFAFCDKQYSEMTDVAGTPIITFDVGGEGSRIPISMPRLTVLAFHAQHAFEHYGNIVTYMRLKGVVPPSSEPRRPTK